MLRSCATKVVRQLGNGSSRASAVLNAVHLSSSSSSEGVRPDGESSALSWATARESKRGFKAWATLHQGIPQREEQLASDIIPDDLVITRSHNLKAKPLLDASVLKFGAEYTDHMLQITWKEGVGWAAPSIDPLGPIPIHPCAQVLHYGMECFEGMKAFKTKDGEIRLFRPDMNMNRFLRSARRLALPSFDKEALLECIKTLLRVEQDWIPDEEGFSLYIRPTIISTYPHLGVGTSGAATIFCVLSPVGPYFSEGLKPVKLFVDFKHVRACPGGIGDAKVGGNYAPTILPQLRGAEKGCSQVLYVLDDGVEGGAIGESGAMNVFFLFKREGVLELATPPLNGVILPGVTRDSVLSLTRSFGGIQVSERRLSWNEIEEASKKGEIVEIFGTGTACMIQPITGLVMEDDREICIPFDKQAGAHWMQKAAGSSVEEPKADEPLSLSGRLTRAILDIQYGHINSTWSVPI